MQLKIGYLFQCPPWARGFCPFRAYGAYMIASALYLCFTLRPAIFNSLRPVTVGSGRVELTCETKDRLRNKRSYHQNTLHSSPFGREPLCLSAFRGVKSCFYLFTHSSPLFTFGNGNRCERQIEGLQISQN